MLLAACVLPWTLRKCSTSTAHGQVFSMRTRSSLARHPSFVPHSPSTTRWSQLSVTVLNGSRSNCEGDALDITMRACSDGSEAARGEGGEAEKDKLGVSEAANNGSLAS